MGTGWRRLIGCLKLQLIFRKRAINYRALVQKMICKDKASYGSSSPCTSAPAPRLQSDTQYAQILSLSLSLSHTHTHTHIHPPTHTHTHSHTFTHTHSLSIAHTHRHTELPEVNVTSPNTIHTNRYTHRHTSRYFSMDWRLGGSLKL